MVWRWWWVVGGGSEVMVSDGTRSDDVEVVTGSDDYVGSLEGEVLDRWRWMRDSCCIGYPT